MKNQFLFLVIVLNCCLIYAQTINIPIITSDGVTPYQDTLRVGLDLSATDCIDSLLGEPTITPPIPPAGVFSSFLQLPSFCNPLINTKLDFRNAPAFPFTGQKEHRLIWQLSTGASSFILHYNFPESVTANIKDNLGGSIFNQNLQNSGSYSIPFQFISSAILTVYYDNVLPVELNSFKGSLINQSVRLSWMTSTEINNSGFSIERLKDFKFEKSNEWKTIGFVNGNGTTTETHSYSFIDENVTTGTYKYRLKQIDFDGTYKYSNEIEVVVDLTPKEFVLFQNYPNPFNPTTKIKYSIPNVETHRDVSLHAVSLKVFDILGNEVATLVNENKPAGSYEVEFNSHSDKGQNLTSGIYFYRIAIHSDQFKAGSFVQTRKMILIK